MSVGTSEQPPRPRPTDGWRRRWLFVIASLALIVLMQGLLGPAYGPRRVPYSEFIALLRQDRLERVAVSPTQVTATFKPAAPATPPTDQPAPVTPPPAGGAPAPPAAERPIVAHRLPGVDDKALHDELLAHGVAVVGEIDTTMVWNLVLSWLIPLALIGGLWWFMARRAAGRGGPLSFGRTRAKIYDRNQAERVTFADVAGVDEAEAELIEVVDFLRDSARYRALGARIPRGVLLVGPPGTGKTLLARAVAGEAEVPFFSLSGSDFVEMFVGVGAARMRDLFTQAKERAPCIVFIDELDAIGRARGGIGAMATHDEREQTLNQLLVEMDGFEAGVGVIIMSATNRPEVLDPALLRAGRFDRQVLVDRPDLNGREAILRVHARKVKVADGLDLRQVAQRTPGMVGADLANVVNEAAICAARSRSAVVAMHDFEEAIDRMQLGLKKRGSIMNADEKRRVAYHEAGHALCALSVPRADPVHRVTIIPRSIGALGATLQLPTEERYLMTRDELADRICVMLSGRAAELLIMGDLSTGAANDLERVTALARQMITRYGMNERLGAVTYGRSSPLRFLAVEGDEQRTYSETTAQAIDDELKALVEGQAKRALGILDQRRAALERIARALLERETLARGDLDALIAA
ncbi:MAG TPA: ATP-dependent zinc metalloprotease FtsH [Planctomycetota bacterium]|nr:ATP-dependent zinc metalloprotease FtsH [Planctomycetota bacterium]